MADKDIEVSLTRDEFDEFVFEGVSRQTVPMEVAATAAGLIDRLSHPASTEERPLSPHEVQQQARHGRKLWPGRRLVGDSAVFRFSVDEHELLVQLLENTLPQRPVLVLGAFHDLLEKLRGAAMSGNGAGP